jgi:hypothetical protein
MSTANLKLVEPAPPDLQKVARAIALNTYGRKGDFLSESWASAYFKATYKAALALCADKVDNSMGFDITWYPPRHHIGCTHSRIFDGKCEFFRELPLEGALADALLADLESVALAKAVVDLKAEDEEALRIRAQARLDLMMKAADCVQSGLESRRHDK